MKFTLLFFTLLCFSGFKSQMFTNTNCLGGVNSATYGVMNTNTSSVSASNRTASIYRISELSGIVNKTITSVYFKRYGGTSALTGTLNFKIYLKEVSQNDFGSGALDWATAITGATLVYDGDPTVTVGNTTGWKQFISTTPFSYSGTQNLAVFVEFSNTGGVNNGSGWEYNYTAPCIDTSNNNTTKYVNSVGSLGASLSSSNYRRVLIGFDYVSLSVNEVEINDNKFSIAPNPVNETLFIKSSKAISTYTIHNAAGVRIKTGKITDNSINVGSVPAGTYILSLQYSDDTVSTSKFIKK